MKKLLLSTAFLALCAGAAFAADLPSRKAAPILPPPPPPPPMWTGFYGGVNIGGGWGAGNGNSNVANLYGANGGVTNNIGGGPIGGLQLGYNYQFGGLSGMGVVVGVETDFQGSGLYGNRSVGFIFPDAVGPYAANTPYGYSVLNRLDYFGTVRGRLGLSITPTLLVYGTGGFTYGFVYRGVTGFYGSYTSALQTGWNAGGGVEWMFMPNWSAKAEYLYSDISGGGSNNSWYQGNVGLGLNSGNNHTRWNTVRAGVNYHFNFGGAAPILAKY
jgi:outer membrane immunogenic protein